MSVKVVSLKKKKKVNQLLGCKMFSGNFRREALKSNINKNTKKITEIE